MHNETPRPSGGTRYRDWPSTMTSFPSPFDPGLKSSSNHSGQPRTTTVYRVRNTGGPSGPPLVRLGWVQSSPEKRRPESFHPSLREMDVTETPRVGRTPKDPRRLLRTKYRFGRRLGKCSRRCHESQTTNFCYGTVFGCPDKWLKVEIRFLWLPAYFWRLVDTGQPELSHTPIAWIPQSPLCLENVSKT